MMRDSTVDMSVRVMKTPILGADYYVEPYSNDPADLLVAEFIENNLFEGMTAPFNNSLEDILHFCEDGYSVVEKVYETREWSASAKGANTKTYTMLKKLGVRPAQTVQEIVYDNNGGPTQVVQGAIQSDGTSKQVTIDIAKVMVFSWNKSGGNLQGKSILRTAYPHWFYKTHMYKMDAIQKERHAIGIPRGKVLPGAKESDKIMLRTLLRNLRSNEESFVIQTPTIEIDFIEPSTQLVDVIKSAEHHNAAIMANVMGQFLVMGMQVAGGSGGRNTASTGADMFMKAMKHVANYIAQTINMYLIPELVVWNFPTKNFPQLKCRNIGETRDLQMLGAALANLFAQGALTTDMDTENWIRETFDMPDKLPDAQPTVPVTPKDVTPLTPEAILAAAAGKAAPTQTNGTQTTPPTNGKGPKAAVANQKGNVTPGAVKTGNVGVPPMGAH
jgi:hypothetical protein